MESKEYLKEHRLLMDGAMETYFDAVGKNGETMAEYANESDPECIKKIHCDSF